MRDVEEITEVLQQDGIKAGKYTGQMNVEECKQADQNLLHGDTSILVATESFKLGVDNPNISQVIRIGCPHNFGVLLQELGRAGRKPGSVATGILYFNEVVDDKQLGLWLKSTLETKENDQRKKEEVKLEIIHTYVQA